MLDIVRIKNVNKNPVAEKAIAELESEILRQDPTGDTLTAVTLSLAIARLNSRIRFSGLSSQELFFGSEASLPTNNYQSVIPR